MKLLGLVSCYREGRLVQGAIRSVLAACDHVIVFEGPAGERVGDDCPATDIPAADREAIVYREGEWHSDAVKRTALVKATRGYGDGPIWGVWVDGDEVLLNGEYLRDLLQAVLWRDEQEREKAIRSGDRFAPTAGFPIRLVEMDGSVALCRAKVVRVDLIDSYIVSSSGIRFKSGQHLIEHAEGNLPQRLSEWWAPRARAMDEDRMYLAPPLPGEPFLLHRSPLRHPARQAARMHLQEARELERLGLLTSS